MSNTIRWYQNPKKIKGLTKERKSWIHPYKYVNPFWFKHEIKFIRVKEHRRYRHMNRIRIKRRMNIIVEPKTNGWLTH